MANAEAFGEQSILGVDHIAVIVLREFRFQAIGGFRAPAVAERVRDDDVILGRIEGLARAEQFICEGSEEHTRCRTTGPVQYNDGCSSRLADGPVMQFDFWQDLAGVKLEIPRNPLALLWCGIIRCRRHNGWEYKRKHTNCFVDFHHSAPMALVHLAAPIQVYSSEGYPFEWNVIISRLLRSICRRSSSVAQSLAERYESILLAGARI